MESALKSFISRLKEVRTAKGVSYEQIVSGVSKSGYSISLTTVKRVFSANSENAESFRWSTLQPIGYFLLGMEQTDEFSPANAPIYYSQSEALKADIEIRQKEKELLESSLADMRRENAEKSETIAGLRRQVRFQRILVCALAAALVLFALSFLIFDLTNPNFGIFYRI